MLEIVDLRQKLEKDEYQKVFPPMEERLAELQRQIKEAKIPVVIVFEGWDAAGKGTCINRLMLPLDPRGFKVWPIFAPSDTERFYPFLWRFWNKLPARGRMAIFDHSWYTRVLDERVDKLVPAKVWKEGYDDIIGFERQLTDEGYVLVKFWFHISKKEQKKRFEDMDEDPATSWKITKEDWKRHKQYDDYLAAVEEMLQRTSGGNAPWTVVEAHDLRFARTKIFSTLISALEHALERHAAAQPASKPVKAKKATGQAKQRFESSTVLASVDLKKSLTRDGYEAELDKLQARVRELEFEVYKRRIPVIVTYEGWDAAGKGGNIKRLTANLDPRGYEVIPIAAPAGEEREQHYLWRFWRQIPKAGHIAIFDRTWYGRVLVERLEGFCSPEAWQRAYSEINEFEAHLVNYGTVLVKFWLHIDKAEQLRRFTERKGNPQKAWKLTEEDFRNREKWDEYESAIDEMIQRTSTTYAPWTIVEANDKYYARVKALRTVVDAIERALKHAPKEKRPYGARN